MMRLQNVRAVAHPDGNRIDLSWENPDPEKYPDYAVRVVRRKDNFPQDAEDGIKVPVFSLPPRFAPQFTAAGSPGEGLVRWFMQCGAPMDSEAVILPESGSENIWRIAYQDHLYRVTRDEKSGWFDVYNEHLPFASDCRLQAETVYYYLLIPSPGTGTGATGESAGAQQVAAMATGPYDFDRQLFAALPRIYHRYDEANESQLARFLALPGGQLDMLYSLARGLLNLGDLDRVDGRLLPLLAGWIGWQLDFRHGLKRQRNEIRSAPTIYQALGTIPTLEATVKRVLGRSCRTKEFTHNVYTSNNPPRLNLYTAVGCIADVGDDDQSGAGQEQPGYTWQLSDAPLNLEFAYEGRPAVVVVRSGAGDGSPSLWLFYHVRRQGQWDIWYKKADVGDQLELAEWQAGEPLTNRAAMDRHPTAVAQGERIWLFWDVYDEASRTWWIDCQTHKESLGWAAPQEWPFTSGAGAEEGVQRKSPSATVDDRNGVWLFWWEQRDGGPWLLKYNWHDGSQWRSVDGTSLPVIGGGQISFDDLFVLFEPEKELPPFQPGTMPQLPKQPARLWVLGARKAQADGQLRWEIVYTFKVIQKNDKGEYKLPGGWAQKVFVVAPQEEPDDTGYDDREPAACLDDKGVVRLFWSSNRSGSWSVWHGRNRTPISPLPRAVKWSEAVQITAEPYMQRSPAVIFLDECPVLVYRANQPVAYASPEYSATRTVDGRYVGSTTLDTKALAHIETWGTYEDYQSYACYALQGELPAGHKHAANVVGIFVERSDADTRKSEMGTKELVLNAFLPAQVRPVFVTDTRDIGDGDD